jgi:predicted tellurium resistance membrane protein TerC
MKQKIFIQVLAYVFVFWLGAKMVILTDRAELSTYDWLSLIINLFFTIYFVWNSHSETNNKQIL